MIYLLTIGLQTVNYYLTIHTPELILFDSNILKIKENSIVPSICHCWKDSPLLPPPPSPPHTHTQTFFDCACFYNISHQQKQCYLTRHHKTAILHITLFHLMNCCTIKFICLPLTIWVRCVRINCIDTPQYMLLFFQILLAVNFTPTSLYYDINKTSRKSSYNKVRNSQGLWKNMPDLSNLYHFPEDK